MNTKPFLILSLLFSLLALLLLAACRPAGGDKPAAVAENQTGVIDGTTGAETIIEKVSIADCSEAVPGAHQLIDAVQGICFLYPDNYDVFQGEDGSLTLYVRSLLNTEAPLATVRLEALNGRAIQEIIPDYPSDAELAAMSLLTIELGGEQATVLDNLPGQDVNRRVIALHNGRLVDMMVARIGDEYGAVGEQAEALYQMITETFQFIGIEPEAPLLAGPECPEPVVGTTLFTNAEDGFCLLLPDGYAVDDSLTTDNGGAETAVYVDSLMDSAHPRLFITVEEANGRSLNDITAEKAAEVEAIMGSSPMWTFGLMLDGVPANQFDQAPGQDLTRQVVLVRDGRFYTLTFIPDDPEAVAYADLQILYDTVMDSFSFLWQN
ncbi:MAG: hypothetical protein HND44_06595 [Chloroflexi bacterium]|nr:hypothetical protein [Ardenticatenaceae bacterium]MBL1128158.1 hypothetical protein [Chloroflexota bacterium]NOG34231.1 hypothetical protein [Chloroflexota bacterium]GIK56345.1 MAG: hypothetical protein BroJett015_20080 [Chloroflexota bacterium]